MSEKEKTDNLNIVTWELHETHPDLVEPLRESLSKVIDPEIGLSVLQLGLIRKVSIEEDIAKLYMILTTPFCPYAPAMLEATRKAAQDALKLPATVDMGMEPWDFSLMEDPSALDWGMYS
ncbi:MAG: iron-sulfur cluster assembly protein [Anaerolineales bacterium]|nr:iron-sulfur cluster assembly protein [Anaerolineales bacterium]